MISEGELVDIIVDTIEEATIQVPKHKKLKGGNSKVKFGFLLEINLFRVELPYLNQERWSPNTI